MAHDLPMLTREDSYLAMHPALKSKGMQLAKLMRQLLSILKLGFQVLGIPIMILLI